MGRIERVLERKRLKELGKKRVYFCGVCERVEFTAKDLWDHFMILHPAEHLEMQKDEQLLRQIKEENHEQIIPTGTREDNNGDDRSEPQALPEDAA